MNELSALMSTLPGEVFIRYSSLLACLGFSQQSRQAFFFFKIRLKSE